MGRISGRSNSPRPDRRNELLQRECFYVVGTIASRATASGCGRFTSHVPGAGTELSGGAHPHLRQGHHSLVQFRLPQRLDTDLYFALKMPLAKRSYRLIDQRRREAMSWSVDAVELRNLLAMSKRYRASSRIFEVLNTAHRALKREKFLESVTLDRDTIRYKVHRDFARDWFEEADQPTSLRWQAVQALKAKGVYPNRARTLVESYGAEKAFHVLDVLSVREGVINEGAWVAKVMDEGDAEELAEMSEFVVSRRAGEKVAGSQPSLMAGGEESSVDGTELPRLASDAAAQEIWEKVLEVARAEIDVSSRGVVRRPVGCGLRRQRLTIGVPNSSQRITSRAVSGYCGQTPAPANGRTCDLRWSSVSESEGLARLNTNTLNVPACGWAGLRSLHWSDYR